jgi:hypothetical protein
LGGVLAGSLAFGAGLGIGSNTPDSPRTEYSKTKSSENEPRKVYNKQKEVVVSSILSDDKLISMTFYTDYDVDVDIALLRSIFSEYCSDKNISFFRNNDLSYILETLKVFGGFDQVNSIKRWNFIRNT